MNLPSTQVSDVSPDTLAAVILNGDLAKLTPNQKVDYMLGVCKSMGLNPATKPFEFIALNGKLTMYARKDCTEQLRKIHGVSIKIVSREIVSDCYVVQAQATDKTGKVDESLGAVSIAGLKGENLSNAMMKAETKAKRRVTLSICGLGMLDETEVSSIPGVVAPTGEITDSDMPRVKMATVTGEIKTKKPEWTPEQTAEAGSIRADLIAIDEAADKELRTLYNQMKYDSPSDVIDAMNALLAKWRDIASQSEAEVTIADQGRVYTGSSKDVAQWLGKPNE